MNLHLESWWVVIRHFPERRTNKAEPVAAFPSEKMAYEWREGAEHRRHDAIRHVDELTLKDAPRCRLQEELDQWKDAYRNLLDWAESQGLDCTCYGPNANRPGQTGGEGCSQISMQIRLERDDAIPAFGAFLRCEAQHDESHVILINVQACMAPEMEGENGSQVTITREDRIRLIITSIMHEFGHALESHFRLPVNEDHIESACMAWETAYSANAARPGQTEGEEGGGE